MSIKISEYQRKVQFRFKTNTINITSLSKMKWTIPILVVVGLFIGVNSDKVRYDNYRLYSVQAKSDNEISLLQAIESDTNFMTFLTSPSIQTTTDIVVPPYSVKNFESIFTRYGLTFEIKTDNFQR